MRLAALTILGLALVAAPAQAKTVHAKRINAPAGIRCWAVMPVAGKGIECGAPFLAKIGELDPYLAVSRHGRAILGERGDYTGYSDRPKRMADGDTWRWKGVTCRLRDRGLTCRNADGHGFVLKKGAIRRF